MTLAKGTSPSSSVAEGKGEIIGFTALLYGICFTMPFKMFLHRHYPKQSFTTVADTPENLRLKQQSELQSQVTCRRPTLGFSLY